MTTRAIDAVVTHHRDGFRSGVARFNELLAERLAVPLVGLTEAPAPPPEHPLLSFKVSELAADEREAVGSLLERRPEPGWDVFLHELSGLELETGLLDRARRIYAGNHEIAAALAGSRTNVETVWAPGLVLDDRLLTGAALSVFSFGMAHKIRTDMFERLRGLLDATGLPYVVHASAANHETASLRDTELVLGELADVFGDSLFFLGNLSDVAVFNELRRATYFAAFFERGVRANNTSVASAMERGAVVVTNLDTHSPPDLEHGDNVIDIEQCRSLPTDPAVLARIGGRAAETARARDWDRLVARLGGAR